MLSESHKKLFMKCKDFKKSSGKPIITIKERDLITYLCAHSITKTMAKFSLSQAEIKNIQDVAINKLRQAGVYTYEELADIDDPYAIEQKLADGTFGDDPVDLIEQAHHPLFGWK